LLVACAFAPPGIGACVRVAHAASGIRDWQRLEQSAAIAQLRPCLAALLSGVELRSAAALAARARIAAEAQAHEGRGLLLAAELLRVLEALARAGVTASPFKGPALAWLVGGGAVAREMNDLDVLVDERDLRRAIEALAAIGYAPALAPQAVASQWLARVTNELPFFGTGPCMIEVHWRLAPPWYPAAVTVPDVLSHLVPRDFFRARISWPDPEALLLVHVADGMKSGGFGLRWLGDLAAILRDQVNMDWERVEALARGSGGLNNVRIALALAGELGETAAEILDDARASIALHPRAQALASQARRSRRLSQAVRSIARRLATDTGLESAAASFAWAVQVSDSRTRTAAAIARHLAGPSVTDLEAMPPAGIGDRTLRARAWARRLGSAAR
jgi:hypothetical protein